MSRVQDFRRSYDSDKSSTSSEDDPFTPRKKTKSINEPLLLPGDGALIPARDTSFRAWLTVFFAMLSYSAALAILYSFGVYVVPLEEHFQTGRGGVSWVGSIIHFCSYFAGIFAGASVQKFGPRFTTVLAGVMLVVAGTTTPYVTAVWHMYLSFGILSGTAVAFAVIPAMSVVVTWFDKYRGIATGLTAAGAGLGNLVAPLVAQMIMDQGVPNDRERPAWRHAIGYLTAGCGGVIILAAFFLEYRPSEGATPLTHDMATGKKKSEKEMVADAMKTRYFRYFLAFVVIGSVSFNVPALHISPYAESRGISDDNSALILSIMGAAQIFGRIGHGVLADYIGAVESLTGAVIIMGISAIIWPILFDSFSLIATFAVIYGANVGAVYALPSVVIANYFTGMKPSSLLGIYFTFGSPLMLIGPVIAGYIYDATGTYFAAAFTIGVPLLISSAFLVLMVRTHRAEKRYLRVDDADADDADAKDEAEEPICDDAQGEEITINGEHIVVSYSGPHSVNSQPEHVKIVNSFA